MSTDVVEILSSGGEMGGAPAANKLEGGDTTSAAAPQYSEDLMVQFGLQDVLERLRSRKLRSSFSHYITEIQKENIPLKPRCPAGSLAEIALQPINEDERKLELFDDRVLRNALTLKESTEKPPMPDWLDVEQPWGDDDRKKRRKDRRKKRKKRKRKRGHDDGGDGEDGGRDDEERRAKKKRK